MRNHFNKTVCFQDDKMFISVLKLISFLFSIESNDVHLARLYTDFCFKGSTGAIWCQNIRCCVCAFGLNDDVCVHGAYSAHYETFPNLINVQMCIVHLIAWPNNIYTLDAAHCIDFALN